MRQDRSTGCIFCDALKGKHDSESLVVYRAETCFVILNRYPYTSGHLMVVPNEHQPSLNQLDIAALHEIMGLIRRAECVLRKVYSPDGLNVGANIGAAAGAGIAEHVHFHVVPRWGGDTNFMSTLANSRVLPETLSDTYARLYSAWRSDT
jgi:ATP adenylyltransferase